MNIQLPVDLYGFPIQALAPAVTASVAIGAASARVELPAGSQVIRIAVTNDCHMEIGLIGVVASGASIFMPKGSEVVRVPNGATHVAFIQLSVAGVASVTRMV